MAEKSASAFPRSEEFYRMYMEIMTGESEAEQ